MRALDDAARTGVFAVDMMYIDRPEVRDLPTAWQVRVTILAALTYLHEHGMITVSDPDTWPLTLPLQVPDAVLTAVTEETDRYRRMAAPVQRRRGRD